MKNLIDDFIWILTNPEKVKKTDRIIFSKILTYFSFFFFVLFISAVVLSFLFYDNDKSGTFNTVRITNLAYCFTIPLYEEILFRLFLRKRFSNFILIIIIILFLIAGEFLSFDPTYFIILAYSLFCIIISVFDKKEIDYEPKTLLVLTYLSCFLFGLVHLLNLKTVQLDLFTVSYILHKILIGFILCLLRLRFGFIFAILFHVVINTFTLSFS